MGQFEVRRGAAAVLLCASVASSASAKDFGEHGGYEVVAVETTSETNRGACVMAEDDFEGPGGTRLRLFRYVENPDIVLVTVDNYNWTTVDKQKYDLSYLFDDYSYDRTATGYVDGIHHGFSAGFPHREFMQIFGKSSFLHIYMNNEVVDKLSLDGSSDGRAAFDRCWAYVVADDQKKARERARWKDIPKDPFGTPEAGTKPERG